MPSISSRIILLFLCCTQFIGCGLFGNEEGIKVQGKWVSSTSSKVETYEFETDDTFLTITEYPNIICSGKETKGGYEVNGNEVCYKNVVSRTKNQSATDGVCDEL